MRIELVQNTPAGLTGIGKYTAELYANLRRYGAGRFDIAITPQITPPYANQFTILRNFPMGIQQHVPGSIVHFTQIMSCAQMLWNPVKPSLATVHDLGVLVCPEDQALRSALDHNLLRMHLKGLQQIPHFLAISRYTASTLEHVLGIAPERIHIAYQGIDHTHFQPVSGARALIERKYGVHFAEDTIHILYVGTELPRKNLATLLEGIALLHHRGCKVQFIKAGSAGGDQWRQATDQHIRQMDIYPLVTFIDRVAEEDLPALYTAADIFSTLSLLEGFCRPVVEAMACGTPVVCSNTTALPEVVGQAGVLVSPHDAAGWASAVQSLAEADQAQTQLRDAGRKQAARFTFDSSTTALMDIYEHLLMKEAVCRR